MGKMTIGILFGLLYATLAPAQVPDGISGTWKMTSSWGAGDQQSQIDLVMMLGIKGGDITGSIGPSEDVQPITIAEGKIDGNSVLFYLRAPKAIMRISFRLQDGKAEGDFRSETDNGVTIEGTGTGRIQAKEMTFQWTSSRNGQTIQGKLVFTKLK